MFDQLITRVLKAHDCRGDAVRSAPVSAPRFSGLRIVPGRFFQTLEWHSPLGTAFGVGDENDDFRTEAPLEFAHGDCAVVVEASPFTERPTDEESAALVEAIRSTGSKRIVIFVNSPEQDGFARWRGLLRPLIPPEANCDFSPVALGSISFMILIASLIYLDFAAELRWKYLNYL